MKERISLKQEVKLTTVDEDMKVKIEARILEIEKEIGNDISEKYHKEIIEEIKKFGGDKKQLNGTGRKNLWKYLKRKYPKSTPAVPVGKKDKSGNVITNHEGLKQLYLNTYVHRLRNRPIKQDYQEIKELKEELFELRLELSNCNQSVPWNMEDLEFVLSL